MLMIWLFSLRVLMSFKKRWTLCMIIRDLTVNVDKTKVITFIYGDKIKSKLWINLFTLVFCKTSMLLCTQKQLACQAGTAVFELKSNV